MNYSIIEHEKSTVFQEEVPLFVTASACILVTINAEDLAKVKLSARMAQNKRTKKRQFG